MTFLPIVARELRVAVRRRGTHGVRLGAALALILASAWFLLGRQNLPPRALGQGLLGLLTGTAFLYCLLSGVWLTADCLSEEKREGTLGLLFLTDLKGYDVVLGKVAAKSLNALYAVLAVVPILALPVLLGGVTGGEFTRLALVALNTLFFSLALGICISAMSRSPRNAMAMTFLLILLVTAALPACGWCRAGLTGNSPVGKGWVLASPAHSYYRAWDLAYRTAAEEFWWSVAAVHGLGWLCLLLASATAPRTWQIRPAGSLMSRWHAGWRRWMCGSPAYRARFRKQLLGQNAYFWLAARARWKPACVWGALGLLAVAWLWGLAKWGRDWLDAGVYLTTGLLLNGVIKAWFALEAGRRLGEDRKEGALELLLSTPLTVQDILRGQWLALRRQFQGPVMVVLLLFLLFMLLGAVDPLSRSDLATPRGWVLLWTAAIVMLVADLAGLYWFGLWRGIKAKNPDRAGVQNLRCILLLPWVVTIVVMLVVPALWAYGIRMDFPVLLFALWFGLGLAADLGFGLWARHKLLTEFRLAAARRYEQRRGFWERLFMGS
jgi:hypothetical protein